MDTPETNIPAESLPNDWRSEFEALRQLIISLLILVLIISGTFNIFLARQWKYSRDDVRGARAATQNLIADYEKNNAQLFNAVVNRLREFGQTNADFVPILTKYNLRPSAPPSLIPPSAGSATSAPAKK